MIEHLVSKGIVQLSESGAAQLRPEINDMVFDSWKEYTFLHDAFNYFNILD